MENGLHLTLVALKREWHDIKNGKRSLPTTIDSDRIPTPSLHGEFKTVFQLFLLPGIRRDRISSRTAHGVCLLLQTSFGWIKPFNSFFFSQLEALVAFLVGIEKSFFFLPKTKITTQQWANFLVFLWPNPRILLFGRRQILFFVLQNPCPWSRPVLVNSLCFHSMNPTYRQGDRYVSLF